MKKQKFMLIQNKRKEIFELPDQLEQKFNEKIEN